MKDRPITLLSWKKAERAQLSGTRTHHRLDVPVDRLEVAWADIASWLEAGKDLKDTSTLKAVRAAVRSARKTTRPKTYDPAVECLRFYACEVAIQAKRIKRNGVIPFALLGSAFGAHLAGYGVTTALAHSWNAPYFERHGSQICVEKEILGVQPAWLRYPLDFETRYSLDRGYAFYRSLRQHVFELDDEEFSRAWKAAQTLRAEVLASDASDKLSALHGLAFVFAREGTWAVEHAKEIIKRPKKDGRSPGSNLILPSLTDAELALRLIKAQPEWLDKYGATDPLVYDIVEALGSDSVDVVRAIKLTNMKPRVKTFMASVIRLAKS